jgi:PAS domain S-box-containing protein
MKTKDFAQPKKIEPTSAEKKEEFMLFQFSVFDVIYRYDPQNNRYDFISPSVELQTGYTAEEFLSHPKEITQRITHPQDWERVQAEVKREIAKGPPEKSFCVEYRVTRKNGKQIWVSDQKTLEFSSEGKLCRINGVVRDITERKGVEEALRKSEEKYRFLFEQSPVINMIISIDGRIEDINESMINKLGYSKDEIIGKHAIEFIVPEQKERAAVELERCFRGEPTPEIDFGIQAKDGSIRTILFSPGQVILHEEGQHTSILITGIDVTERKQAEEALRSAHRKLQATFDAIQESMNVVDLEFNLTEVNDALIKRFGLPGKESALGHKCFEILKGRREVCPNCAVAEAYRTKAPAYRTSSPEDKEPTGGKSCEIFAYPIMDDPGNLIAAVEFARDVTERKQAEEKLREYTRQIEEKNRELKAKNRELTVTRAQLVQKEKLRALGQMASGVAHNFNNLLTIILGRAQLLQLKAKELETEKGARIIERAALDAASTIKRIQDFARVRKDQEFKWVNLDQVIEDVIALTKTKWKDQAEVNGITIELEVEKDQRRLPSIAGDVSELKEAFANIIFNAVEAMPNGGKIVIRTRTDRKSVFVSFIDSGIGIPEEVKQKIFDPFFTTKGVRNAGLGLSMAYGVIQRHQGDIKIESKQEKGTTVVVRLPVSKGIGKEELKGRDSDKPPAPRESANILVIEDEKGIRELLFDILISANHKVKLTSGGAEGLEICRREKFDMVFTDLGMPQMSGWEVAKAIKEIDSNITVCLITGWGVEMEEEKLKESRIDRVVTKPVKMETLLALVSETIESKKRIKPPIEGSFVCPVKRNEIKI